MDGHVMRGDPWGPMERAALREIVAQLDSLDETTGGWTAKLDARQTGFSLHIRFDKKVDIMKSLEAAAVFEHGPEKLCQIVNRIVGQLESEAAR